MAKTFEFVVLDHLLPTISEPQLTYQKGVSFSEAIFTCQDVISKLTQDSDHVYNFMFLWFSIRFRYSRISHSLKPSKNTGVMGKAWHLIRQWYRNPKSSVRMKGMLSSPFTIHRGVWQGSVLSPVLFLLVMDPILLELQKKFICGLSVMLVSWLGLDVQMTASHFSALRIRLLLAEKELTASICLLQTDRLVRMSSAWDSAPRNKPFMVNNLQIPVSNSARCLCAWWSTSLSSSKWIEN